MLGFARILVSAAVMAGSIASVQAQEEPEEIVVVGRQPGPPLWRVNNGDNVLWIFPTFEPVPKDMIWESDRVAQRIAESQEVLLAPDSTVDAPLLTVLNPINIFRGVRLARRLSRNGDEATLQEVLPADLYARFAALQERYFADAADEFAELRPLVAGGRMVRRVQEENGLVPADDIQKSLQRLIRRNRGVRRTENEVAIKIEGNYRTLADRAEALMASIDPGKELECFASQVSRMENDLGALQSAASAWARGYVDEFRDLSLNETASDPCLAMAIGSSEQEMLVDLLTRRNRVWLDNAERALNENRSTFAILPMNMLLAQGGVLSQLKAKGFAVREP